MTQQFKFGDRVRWADDPGQFVYLHQAKYTPEAGWIIGTGVGQHLVEHSALQAVPHPDTVRLDWLESKGWKPKTIAGGIIQLTRKAIDAVMREKAA